MKKKLLLRTCMLVLPFLVVNQPVKAQDCYPWEVWSCYYTQINSSVPTLHCGCVSSNDAEAQQCSDGQVLACRHHKCKWECKCMDLSDVEKWIARGNGCHNTGGGPYGNGNGNGGPHRSAVGRDSVAYLTFFSGLYPNPVSDFSIIAFSLATAQKTRITLFDLNGRQVALLADELFGVGDHEVVWNAEEVPAGLYMIQLQSKELLHTATVVVMK